MSIRIMGTGSSLPEKIVTNDDLAKVMDTSDQWIYSRSGIRQRHIATTETTTQLACQASRKALEESGITADELDYIFLATVTPDNVVPSAACEVQEQLGADHAVCMDINAACSGFLFALNTAAAYASAGLGKNMLVIGVETLSKIMDWNDRSTCVLFGDGAGAAVVQADSSRVFFSTCGSSGKKGHALTCQDRPLNNLLVKDLSRPRQVVMDGQAVFKFAVKTVPDAVKETLEKAQVSAKDIKCFVFHQANQRIIEGAAKRLHVSADRFPLNLDRVGNTSSASIPILLDEIHKNQTIKRGDPIVLCGFGGGLTWGAVYMEW